MATECIRTKKEIKIQRENNPKTTTSGTFVNYSGITNKNEQKKNSKGKTERKSKRYEEILFLVGNLIIVSLKEKFFFCCWLFLFSFNLTEIYA